MYSAYMKISQEIIDNLKFGLEVLKAAPDDKINLNSFRSITECGTMFCACGLFAQMLYFKSRGLSMERGVVLVDGQSVMQQSLRLNPIFGPSAFSYLFDRYGFGTNDQELGHGLSDLKENHKALAVKRFEFRIDEIEQNNAAYDRV